MCLCRSLILIMSPGFQDFGLTQREKTGNLIYEHVITVYMSRAVFQIRKYKRRTRKYANEGFFFFFFLTAGFAGAVLTAGHLIKSLCEQERDLLGRHRLIGFLFALKSICSRRTPFNCKPPEVHFTIISRVT